MRLLLPWALALTLFLPFPASATPVDASHPVYAFLRRLEMEGRIKPGFLGSLPLPKSEVGRMLEEAHAGEATLLPWERRSLEAFRKEFGLAEDPERFHSIRYRDSTVTGELRGEYFTGGYLEDSLPKSQAFAFGFLSATAEGSYREKLQFISTAGIGQEWSHYSRFTENYNPVVGLPYNTNREGKAGIPQGKSSFDAFRTVAGYEDPSLRFEIGSDWNQWGPGIWQHAFLSQHPWFWVQDSLPPDDSIAFPGSPSSGRYRRGYRYPGEGAPMTQLRMAFHVGPFLYTKVVAQRTGLWNDSDAYMIAHRLEARPWSFLSVGIEELSATAGRPLDWTYVIPLVPIKFAEHELGDRDNIAIAADAEVFLAGHGRLYGELFLDDFSGWDLNFWGDKFAFTVGAEATGLPFQSSLLQIEYARVEPWVFTHHRVNTQLQHYGSLLGSSLPPNSHALHLAWQHNLYLPIELRLEYEFMQRNMLARGGSIFDFHDPAIDGTQKEFLGGVVESRNTITLGGSYQWRRFVEVRAKLGYMNVDNWKSQEGVSLSSPAASGEIYFRY